MIGINNEFSKLQKISWKGTGRLLNLIEHSPEIKNGKIFHIEDDFIDFPPS